MLLSYLKTIRCWVLLLRMGNFCWIMSHIGTEMHLFDCAKFMEWAPRGIPKNIYHVCSSSSLYYRSAAASCQRFRSFWTIDFRATFSAVTNDTKSYINRNRPIRWDQDVQIILHPHSQHFQDKKRISFCGIKTGWKRNWLVKRKSFSCLWSGILKMFVSCMASKIDTLILKCEVEV